MPLHQLDAAFLQPMLFTNNVIVGTVSNLQANYQLLDSLVAGVLLEALLESDLRHAVGLR